MLHRCRSALRVLCAVTLMLLASLASADPISATPRFAFAGNMDFAVTGGSLRNADNTVNACSLNATDSASLNGVPLDASIEAAFLYWAGSGPNLDNVVTLNGATVTADRTFTENFSVGSFDLDFFSGFADVTNRISGNGLITFGGLTVTNTDLGGGASYCSSQAVLSGWGLVVIYSRPSEPLRVINMFDGFQQFRGSQINLVPNNFVVPAAPIDGRIGILTFEGDTSNSSTLGGVSENLVFDGQSTAPVALTNTFNPINNQFNSTVSEVTSVTEFGVDLDVYDISALLTQGDTLAQTTYSSGGDLVLLSLEIISVTNTAAADVGVSKTHSGDFSTGTLNTWDFGVNNAGPNAATGPVTLSDTLPAGITYDGFSSTDGAWSCAAVGQDVTCSHPGPIAAAAALDTVSITVRADAGAVPAVVNTVSVSTSTFDFNSSNDTATDNVTVVAPDLSTSTKVVADLNGGLAQAGDRLRYSITLTETAGVPIADFSLTDVLDTSLTNLNVTNAGGGVDSSTPGSVNITGLSLAAGASLSIEFETDIVGGAGTGTVIANTALVNFAGMTQDVVAADVYVGGAGGPVSGIKPIYLGDFDGSQNTPVLPMPMSRVPLVADSSPQRVRIRRQDNDRGWILTPALQAPLGLDSTSIPVTLQMRRNNSTNARNLRLTLDWTGGFWGCVNATVAGSGTNGLSNTVTREFAFSIPQTDVNCNPIAAAPVTIPAGVSLRLAVDNEPSAGLNGLAIFVYPFNSANGGTSGLELPATTVINVDDTSFFDAAFPAGAVQPVFAPGDTVFIRSTVSDPFGSFDISAVNYTVTDPDGVVQASGSMPTVQDSGAATLVAEVSFAIPALLTTKGDWVVSVTALEGSEGTVEHTRQASFRVGTVDVLVAKLVTAISDPVTGSVQPKSIPMSVSRYTIRVSNTGTLAADVDTLVLTDSLPPQMRLFLGAPAAPLAFVDGVPVSGLSYTFNGLGDLADDLRFSNDGGTTFITPLVDGDGWDATVPKINFIEVQPKGVFAADTGAGPPTFELQFEMRLE
ncbi:MAG: hypothetical protein AAF529_15860 [Pseudomonadota bacterium]